MRYICSHQFGEVETIKVRDMESKNDYKRFWALLREMPGAEKDEIVLQFTGGRTTHLHLMTADEYRRMLRMMDGIVRHDRRERLRRRRSMCLHLLQKIGVDTSDWARVNAYCMNPRIAGRPFSEVSAEGLSELSVKLRMILKKQEAGSPGGPGGQRRYARKLNGRGHYVICVTGGGKPS